MATGSASGKCHNSPHTVGSPESHSEKQIATLGHRAMNKRWGNLLTRSVRRLPAWIPLGIQGEQSWSPLGRRTCWFCDLEKVAGQWHMWVSTNDRSRGTFRGHSFLWIIVSGAGKILTAAKQLWFDLRKEMDLEGKTDWLNQSSHRSAFLHSLLRI